MDGETTNNLWQFGFLIMALLGLLQVGMIWRDTRAASERKEWRDRTTARQDKLADDLNAGLGAVRMLAERKTEEVGRKQHDFEVEVARTYATNALVKETEERMRRDIYDVRELMIAGFAESRTMMTAMNSQLQQLIGRISHRAE